ncbi:MAG: hypothetical protein HKO87_03160 [Acidimicrobiia bacterium]|nr:hypothetical protein [Acidimicrobiia bacterium]
MGLSTILLLCAVAAGLLAAFGARFRRVGTSVGDVAIGGLIGSLTGVLAAVVLVLAYGLDRFGVLHLLYLLVVVAIPLACLLIVVPNLLDADYRTPVRAVGLAALGAVLALAGVWGTHVEPTRLQVERTGLGATGVSRPIVVGVLADLHLTEVGDYERRAVDELLDAEPDIVVLPGDLYQVDGDELPLRLPEYTGLLRRITDRVDTVVLTGGHTDDPDVVDQIAEAAGAVFLADQVLDTAVDGQPVTIAGLSHPLDDGPATVEPELEDLVANYRPDDLVLLVSHSPDPVLTMPARLPVDLMISGHTHGGQVSLPGLGPILLRSDVPRVVAAGGLHLVNGHPIYVSTGVGIERGQAPQLRFRSRPSVGILTIVPS